MADEWLGWHFLAADKRLQFEPRTLVQAGQTLTVTGALVLCVNGLHASKRAIDALEYAPGPVVCRVQLSGEIIEDSDKACARERTCLWLADAAATLHEFACRCAADALRTAKVEDVRLWQAIEAKQKWLRGEVADQDLDAARSAARSAVRSAVRSAAWSAARSPAWSAAESTVRSAVRIAAWSAAWSAARSAAWSAAESAAESAVRSAAWSAAESAARSAQNTRLESMLLELEPHR